MKKLFLLLCVCAAVTGVASAPADGLPPQAKRGGMPLLEALSRRRTIREFRPDALTDRQLNELLWAACGVNRPDGKRTIPTAMNRQDLSVIVLLPAGAYWYDAPAAKLVLHKAGDFRPQASRFDAPVKLLFVSDTEKLKPTPDGRDFAAVHAGAAAQNAALYCASEGLANVWVGGFDPAALSQALELPAKWKIQLTMAVGLPAK
ncbi:MAG: nitroreductase family protein [Lentisphaeria bacterium]|nr:nitroreductase family protein [Lentisphaeria bacterium]